MLEMNKQATVVSLLGASYGESEEYGNNYKQAIKHTGATVNL